MKSLTRIVVSFALALLTVQAIPVTGFTQESFREVIAIPDIPGYRSLKCDFHMHTVFSDGQVWPTVRAEEAWCDGLDAFSITDHVEYQPHKDDIPVNRNRSYEIVRPTAESLGLTLIKGAEITRKMPPGHLNALFVGDIDPFSNDDWRVAIQAAHDQGAFIFWNHPGWKGQQPDGIARWYDEHTELLNKGYIQGIEVVNSDEYYPEVHQWCLDKNLTMMADSDIHPPIRMVYDPARGEHRPMTIVFAKSNAPDDIKEALLAHRTAVYWRNQLIGREEYLKPIFQNSTTVDDDSFAIKGTGRHYLQITNSSDLNYELTADGEREEISFPKSLVLNAHKTILLEVRGKSKDREGEQAISLPYRVTNLLVRPGEGLPIQFEVRITFTKAQ